MGRLLFFLVLLSVSFQAKASFLDSLNGVWNDPSQGPSCVDVMCSQGGFHCSFSSELNHVLQLCRGQVDGTCVYEACAQGGYQCSFSSELAEIARLCRGVHGNCVHDVCSQGSYQCTFSSDLKSVIQFCKSY